jgi:hypothetical protein
MIVVAVAVTVVMVLACCALLGVVIWTADKLIARGVPVHIGVPISGVALCVWLAACFGSLAASLALFGIR